MSDNQPTKKIKKSPLDLQQQRFIAEYVVDHNGTQAAIRAGYSPTSARSQASRMLADPRISEAIEILQGEAVEKLGITVDRVIQELALIGFSNLKDLIVVDKETGAVDFDFSVDRKKFAPITEVSIVMSKGKVKTKTAKIRLADKIAALVHLGKHLGAFKDQVEISGNLSLADLIAQSFEVPKATDAEITSETPEDTVH